jgi:hypothetical protein
MAQRSTDSGSPVAGNPKKLRRQMAKTRAALADDLGQLKSRLLDTPGTPPKGRKRTMTTKKANPKSSSSAKKKTSKSSSSHSRSATKSATRGASKVASKVVAKTKEVLGDMLAGAARGAVKGAAQAILPEEERGAEKCSTERDGHAEDKGPSRRDRKKSEK